MKRKVLFFIILLPLILILHACTKQSDYSQNQLPIAENAEGYTLGLYEGDSIEPKRTFHIEGGTFTKNIVFGNMTSEDEKFLLLIFDHDRQIEFDMNDKTYTNYEFSLSSHQYESMKVELKNIEKGFHSVQYIIIKSPDKEFLKKDQIFEAEQQAQMMNIRVNILHGISTIPSPPTVNVKVAVETKQKGRIHGVFLQTPSDDYGIWLHERANSSTLDYRLLYGNQEQIPMDGYVVTLLNWKQIEIADGRWSIFDYLESGMEKKVNGNVYIPKKGRYYLVGLWLPNPYVELPDTNPYTNSPLSSLRLTIDNVMGK